MSDDLQSLRDAIRQYILDQFLPGESASNLTDDMQLTGTGILDSMSTLKLVSHVEETYGITVDAHEASSDFGTIEDIANLIQRKK